MWWLRQKRDTASAPVADWEALRAAGAGIKRHVLSRLADYLEEFERNAQAAGAHVHRVQPRSDPPSVISISCER